MKEILLTSSVLILALLVLRRAFREKISRRVQYALWGLVLLRLLVPVNLPAADFSVLTAAAPVIGAAGEHTLYLEPVRGSVWAPEGVDRRLVTPADSRFAAIGPPSPDNTRVVTNENQVTNQIEYDRQIDLKATLQPVWFCGMAVMVLWLIGSNLRFWRKLRKDRIPLELPDCRYPVYLVEEGLVSPCLFGLLRPTVYLTPATLESEEGLRHVLAHEQTHARHLDPLWCLLRGVCLAIYWFDPLVWWAAAVSKEDCELACDEGALKRLREDERIPYGQTLLRLIPVKRMAGGVLLTATTMTSNKKRLKERIFRIAENRKTRKAALCAALALTAAVCAVTFTGCSPAEEPGGPAQPVDPTEPAASAQPVDDEADAPDTDGPVLTIPLTDLIPYTPTKVESHSVEALRSDPSAGHHDDEHDEHHDVYQDRQLVGGGYRTAEMCATFAWSCAGNTYVSSHHMALSSFPSNYFLCFPEQEYNEEPFTGLLGYDGLKISYNVELETGECTVNDYYTFEDNGDSVTVYLLARTYGQSEAADIDNDGELELIATDFLEHCQLIFQRDGRLYEADVQALVHENWPGTGDFTGFAWSPEEDCLHIFYSLFSSDSRQDRQLRFDGENLLLYKWF